MERVGMVLLLFTFLLHPLRTLSYANDEARVLLAFKDKLIDPEKVLDSWDPEIYSPCTWFHITCNGDERVTRIDLGYSGLSGSLVPELGKLKNLQYLELNNNSLSGTIPNELGDLTNLMSLDLYFNNLRFDSKQPGPVVAIEIPDRRAFNNRLTGPIPVSLTNIQSLMVVDLSNNDLSGVVPVNGSFSQFTSESFRGNPHLCYPGVGPC